MRHEEQEYCPEQFARRHGQSLRPKVLESDEHRLTCGFGSNPLGVQTKTDSVLQK